jgi:hypothetical protein
LTQALAAKARSEVAKVEVWVPIAHLEVETEFEFGVVRIAPITAELFDRLEAEGCSNSPKDIVVLFNKFRSEMQGLAAVVLDLEAEHERAKEEGGGIASDAIGLLRFFAPPASSLRGVCPIAPLGLEIVPLAKTLIFGEGTFSYTEGVLPGVSTNWQLSKNNLAELQKQGLTTLANLLAGALLNDFALAVRSSVLLFSTGMTFPDILSRMVHTFSSMERLLLRHSAEPTEFTVGYRMSLLLGEDTAVREEIAHNVREAYRLRNLYASETMTSLDEGLLTTFVQNAYRVLRTALANVNAFDTKAGFLEALDARRTI